MKINKLTISNFMGIDQLTLSAGKFNTFSGENGSGKTSSLEALKYLFGTGHDTTVIRNNIGQAVIECSLDDGQSITAKISQSGTTRDIRDQNNLKQKEPSKKIKSLIDALSINPVEFLTAPKKKTALRFFWSLCRLRPMQKRLAQLSVAITRKQMLMRLL